MALVAYGLCARLYINVCKCKAFQNKLDRDTLAAIILDEVVFDDLKGKQQKTSKLVRSKIDLG